MEFDREYIENLVEKIEKILGTNNWQDIWWQHKDLIDYQDGHEVFSEFVDDCYPAVDAGWLKDINPSRILRDWPIDWHLALSEHFDQETEDGNLYADYQAINKDKTDYDYIVRIFYREDLEKLLKKLENKKVG